LWCYSFLFFLFFRLFRFQWECSPCFKWACHGGTTASFGSDDSVVRGRLLRVWLSLDGAAHVCGYH